MRCAVSTLPVAASVAYTTSGYSALRMARERPQAPIIGMTPELATARRLALAWSVYPVLCPEVLDVRAQILEVAEDFIAPLPWEDGRGGS